MASKDKKSTSSDRPEAGETPPPALGAGERQKIERAENLEMAVRVLLAETRMTLEEVLQLGKGSLIPFDKRHDEPLDFYVNDRKIGTGKAVKTGERLALQMVEFDGRAATLGKLS